MKLLAAFTLAACFAILPSCVTAKEIWTKGDKVSVFFICREEERYSLAFDLITEKGMDFFWNNNEKNCDPLLLAVEL